MRHLRFFTETDYTMENTQLSGRWYTRPYSQQSPLGFDEQKFGLSPAPVDCTNQELEQPSKLVVDFSPVLRKVVKDLLFMRWSSVKSLSCHVHIQALLLL